MRRVFPRLHGRVAAFVLPVIALPALAQLRIDQAVEMALRNNRELQALRQRLPEARGSVRQAALRPNPTLDATLGNGAIVRNNGYWDGGAGISQQFELGGKRGRRLELAGFEIQAAEWEIREKERSLRASVESAYIEALAAARDAATVHELQQLTERSKEVVAARVAQGEAAALDLSLIDVELGRLRADSVVFANQRTRALSVLRALAGISPQEPLALASALESDIDARRASSDPAGESIATRPDIQLLRTIEKGGTAAIGLERSAAVPNLTASARFSYTYDYIQRVPGPGGASIPIVDRCPVLTVGMSMDLPWRNRNQGNIEAAVARQHAARLRREQMEITAANEVHAARERWQAARDAAEVFEKQVLDNARGNLRIVQGVYEHGELRLLDVINEQRKLIEAQRSYTGLLKEQHLARIELQKAMGVATESGKP